MNNLPNDLHRLIGDYLFKCRKDQKYIINKEYYEIFKKKTKDCEKVYLLKKYLCKKCDKKAIWYTRMIINNLLPG